MSNGEKMSIDPREIGLRPGAELDKGFEAFSGLCPKEEFRSLFYEKTYRPINLSEVEGLKQVETEDLTVKNVRDYVAEKCDFYAEMANEDRDKKRDSMWPAVTSMWAQVRHWIDNERFDKAAFFLLEESRTNYRWVLERETEAEKLTRRGFDDDAIHQHEQAEQYQNESLKNLQRAAVLAREHEAMQAK